MSWRPEMFVDNGWYPNACRFATEEEAVDYAFNLFKRWSQPTDWRAVECNDPVNYVYENGQARALESADT
jgi:hypothetical protein